MCSSTNRPFQNRRSGVALLMVLGLTALLGWFAVEIISKVRDELSLRGHNASSRAALRVNAYQALEVTMAVIAQFKEVEGELYGKSQGWGYPLEFLGLPNEMHIYEDEEVRLTPAEQRALEEQTKNAQLQASESASQTDADSSLDEEMRLITFTDGIKISVRVEDQSGKFPINNTSEERWKKIFEVMGYEMSDASTLIDSLLDWIDRDNSPRLYGAEQDHYQQLTPPYSPRNGPIESLDELRYIQGFSAHFFDEQGMPNEKFEQFKRMVTVRNVGRLNYNAADHLVFQVLEEEPKGFPADRLEQYLAGKDGVRNTLDDRVLRPDFVEGDGTTSINEDALMDNEEPPDYEDGSPLERNRPSRFIDVYVETSVGESTFRLFVAFDLSKPHSGGIYPFEIIEFKEDTLSF